MSLRRWQIFISSVVLARRHKKESGWEGESIKSTSQQFERKNSVLESDNSRRCGGGTEYCREKVKEHWQEQERAVKGPGGGEEVRATWISGMQDSSRSRPQPNTVTEFFRGPHTTLRGVD